MSLRRTYGGSATHRGCHVARPPMAETRGFPHLEAAGQAVTRA